MSIEELIQKSMAETEANRRRALHNATASVDDLVPYQNEHFLNMVDALYEQTRGN
jgi:hypothetical protein